MCQYSTAESTGAAAGLDFYKMYVEEPSSGGCYAQCWGNKEACLVNMHSNHLDHQKLDNCLLVELLSDVFHQMTTVFLKTFQLT